MVAEFFEFPEAFSLRGLLHVVLNQLGPHDAAGSELTQGIPCPVTLWFFLEAEGGGFEDFVEGVYKEIHLAELALVFHRDALGKDYAEKLSSPPALISSCLPHSLGRSGPSGVHISLLPQ